MERIRDPLLNPRTAPVEHEQVWSLQENLNMSDQGHYRQHQREFNEEEEPPPGMVQRSDTLNSTTVFVNPNHVHSSVSVHPVTQSSENSSVHSSVISVHRSSVHPSVHSTQHSSVNSSVQYLTSTETDAVLSGTSCASQQHQQQQQHHQQQSPQQQQQGIKRTYSECEEGPGTVQVILVSGDGSIHDESGHPVYPEELDEIPLGGCAEGQVQIQEMPKPQSEEERIALLNKQDTLKMSFETVMAESQQPKVEMCGDSNQSWSNSVGQESNQSWTHQVPDMAHPSPTGLDPSTVNYPGQYQFDVTFSQLSRQSKNKHWDYSSSLRKLFIDMNKWVQAEFRVGPSPPDGLYVRALPVYAEASHIREAVRRCPNHAAPSDPTNQAPHGAHPRHLIRMDGDSTMYCEDVESSRLSVIFPVQTPHQGTEFDKRLMKFMCLGSDVGGINRRPLKVIFTLEGPVNRVVGRKVVEVRICSCPKRDKQQEEQKAQQQEEQARRIAQRFASTTMVVQSGNIPSNGKKKMDKEKVIMVPVHVDDFRKLNEFAEAAWVCRDPSNSSAIKERRRQLLETHNRDLIRKLDKKPSY